MVLSEKPVIADDTYQLEPSLLDLLVANISSLASVYHKPPEAFVQKTRMMGKGGNDDSDSDSDSDYSSDDENAIENVQQQSSMGGGGGSNSGGGDLLDFGGMGGQTNTTSSNNSNDLDIF